MIANDKMKKFDFLFKFLKIIKLKNFSAQFDQMDYGPRSYF